MYISSTILLMIRTELHFWFVNGVFSKYFGNVSKQGKTYDLPQSKIEPTPGKTETNIRKLRKTQNFNFAAGDSW